MQACRPLALCALLFFTISTAAQKSGEVNTPPAKGERYADKIKVGDPAPDFTLADPTGKTRTTLSSFQGKKPVVLIFGSYT